MECERFERWLDQGRPESEAPAASAHAATCPRCAAALDAALEIDALLATAPPAAPPALTETVMARVSLIAGARRPAWRPEPPALDWWVRAAAEPGVALAFALAALIAWRGAALLALATRGAAWVASALGGLAAAPVGFGPATRNALEITLMLVVPWASLLLFVWAESLVRPRRTAAARVS
jgi:hypothetical protein